MQTLYGYKGNTPIIAQYGVHEFWGGSDMKQTRRRGINKREKQGDEVNKKRHPSNG